MHVYIYSYAYYICTCSTEQRRSMSTHCNTLQHTATCCNTLQYTATRLQLATHTSTSCNILQCTAIHSNTHCNTHCNTLQHTLTQCKTLQHSANRLMPCAILDARRCNTMHQDATRCNIMLHTLSATAGGIRRREVVPCSNVRQPFDGISGVCSFFRVCLAPSHAGMYDVSFPFKSCTSSVKESHVLANVVST